MIAQHSVLLHRADLEAAFVGLVVTVKMLPGPDTPEAKAYRQGYLTGLAAAAAAAGLIRPGASLEAMLLEEGRQ
jgi:hypothetical protein